MQSLQKRLVTRVLGLMVLVWLIISVLAWDDVHHEMEELFDAHLAQAAAFVRQQAPLVDFGSVVEVPILNQYAPRVAFQVFHQGRLVTRSRNAQTEPMAPNTDGFSTLRLSDGALWRVFATHVEGSPLQVYVGEKVTLREDILWAMLASVLWPQILALPLLGLAAWWSVRSVLAPLRQLGALLHRRQPDSLAPVVLQDTPTEMRSAVEALNALLQRIGGMVESERRFTADAAHELRTPIAAIRAQAQVALGAGGDTAQRERALRTTLAGCDRATRLVEQLLTLARMEAAPATAAPPYNLTEVAWRVAAELAPPAMARRQVLELDMKGPCAVQADPLLLEMLLRNLIDNAQRYSPDGARIAVSVLASDGYAVLRVADNGPGMSDEAMAQFGRRFYRELGTGQSGSGLGWSIVQRIAEVSGGEAQVSRSSVHGGLLVSVRWPMASEPQRVADAPWPAEQPA
jgi:two-component system sensor histidine kinase QseC